MRVSVILSTYNSPDWLEKVLWGYAVQTHRAFELVIADDGSTEATRRRIAEFHAQAGLELVHVWHEDRGFRKCTILNRAIAAASADYLVFSDGDCIPRCDFLAQHASLAERGCYLSGGYFKLPLDLSQAITRDDIISGRATDPRWLRAHGVRWSRKLGKLAAGPLAARLLDRITPTKATWNGHNASGWKADLLRVNGFDERMGWGAEDRELGDRLRHCGVRGKQIRYRAVCVHLEHSRGYVDQFTFQRNRAIWRAARRSRATWTPHGILPDALPLPGQRAAA
jgi:glycosyltransferase involved in cell wall biosynthesis